MKHILKAKKRFLCLLLAGALAACLSPAALAAPDGVEVAPGYDYTRFKDAGITLNVYNLSLIHISEPTRACTPN